MGHFTCLCDALRGLVPFETNARKTHGEVLLLVKFVESNTPPWVFLRLLNYANGRNSYKVSHILA